MNAPLDINIYFVTEQLEVFCSQQKALISIHQPITWERHQKHKVHSIYLRLPLVYFHFVISVVVSRSLCSLLVFYSFYRGQSAEIKCRSERTCIFSTSLAQPTTFMPCRTSSFATAAPIPTEAPVTRATLPRQRSITSGTPVPCSSYKTPHSNEEADSGTSSRATVRYPWTQHSERVSFP